MKTKISQKINVEQILREDRAITIDAGIDLRNEILLQLQNPENAVILDFKNVKLFTTAFFNASIGYLVEELGIKDVRDRIEYINISELGEQVYTACLENAEFIVNNPNNILDQIDAILQSSADSL